MGFFSNLMENQPAAQPQDLPETRKSDEPAKKPDLKIVTQEDANADGDATLIKSAKNLDDLINALHKIGELKGSSGQAYKADAIIAQLQSMQELAKDGVRIFPDSPLISLFTRTAGLREKVMQLMQAPPAPDYKQIAKDMGYRAEALFEETQARYRQILQTEKGKWDKESPFYKEWLATTRLVGTAEKLAEKTEALNQLQEKLTKLRATERPDLSGAIEDESNESYIAAAEADIKLDREISDYEDRISSLNVEMDRLEMKYAELEAGIALQQRAKEGDVPNEELEAIADEAREAMLNLQVAEMQLAHQTKGMWKTLKGFFDPKVTAAKEWAQECRGEVKKINEKMDKLGFDRSKLTLG